MSHNNVIYIDHMGTDLSIVNDARISFSSNSESMAYQTVQIPHSHIKFSNQLETDIPVLNNSDISLIKFLARGCKTSDWNHAVVTLADTSSLELDECERILKWAKRMPTHWTPFGHQIMKFRMKAPVPIRTQCFKSKIGMVENEESRRYISTTPELFIPEFRTAPAGDIKQGSGGIHPNNENYKKQYELRCLKQIQFYEDLIADGIAPEQARFVLPQGVYVNWVWTGSLYAFSEFCNKRSDRNHAQHEVADLADKIGAVAKALFPVAWSALTE